MNHFSYAELDMCRNKIMPFWKRFLCRCHLRRCAACRDLLEQLEQDEKLIVQIREIHCRENIRKDQDQ